MKVSLSLCLLWSLCQIGYSQLIFPSETEPQLVFDKGEGFLLEGPTMSPDGMVFFSDIIWTARSGMKAGVIWTFNPETKKTTVFRSPSGMANGLMFDHKGRLVVCEGDDFGGRRVTRTDLNTGLSEIIAGTFDGKKFNAPNDVVIDEQGNVYFSDLKFGSHEPMTQPVHGIYKIDTSGVISLIIAYVRKPNGLIISPDQKTLYVSTADNLANGIVSPDYKGDRPQGSGKLLAFDLSQEGTATFRKELVDFGRIFADGMTIDTEGNIYVALTFSRKLAVFSPEGEKLDELTFPGMITNLTFGRGDYNSTLFVTGNKRLYMLKTNKNGYNLPFE